MFHLSQYDIERIARMALRDYAMQRPSDTYIPVDIDNFAKTYLGLQLKYAQLSSDSSLLGLTAYKDVQIELVFDDRKSVISVEEDTILLNESLYMPQNSRLRRFTIAHECSHQILGRIMRIGAHGNFKTDRLYSCRDLKNAEDWSERQANALSAALLMPRLDLLRMLRGFGPTKFTMYGNRFNPMDYRRIKDLSDRYEVSFTAMVLRLKELGFIDRRHESEYYDPRDIFPDEVVC